MIRVVVDDIAFVEADAVVRPTTATLEPTTAALRRLEQLGGPSFWQQLRVHQDLAVGAAVVTGGGELPVELVIHAVIRSTAEPVSAQTVRRAFTGVLQRAADWQLARLAVPPLGIGAGNLSVEDAARIMIAVLRQHAASASYPSEVAIIVETEADRAVFEAEVNRAPA